MLSGRSDTGRKMRKKRALESVGGCRRQALHGAYRKKFQVILCTVAQRDWRNDRTF